MKKKLIASILALSMCFSVGATMAGCGEDEVSNGKSAYELWLEAGNVGTMEDFLASLKGDQGDKGDKGDSGENGAPGQDGETGAPGQDGEDGQDGQDGVGIVSIVLKEGTNNILVITYSNNTSVEVTIPVTNGEDGEDGKDGEDGAPGQDGEDGKDGEDGAPGQDGEDGVSIVNVALKENTNNVFVITYSNGTFTEVEIPVINGEDGEDGKDGVDGAPGQDGEDGKDGVDGAPGQDGEDGEDGVSIVNVALKEGTNNVLVITYSNDTTTEVIIPVINGEDGKDGVDGAPGQDGEDGKDGVDGAPGQDGEDGKDGKDGEDGVGIVSIVLKEGTNNVLVITYSNGTSTEVDIPVINGEDGKDGVDGAPGQDGADGKDGKDGVSIASITLSADGTKMIITYTDPAMGTTELPLPAGQVGATGVGIAGVEFSEDGSELIFKYTDGTTVNVKMPPKTCEHNFEEVVIKAEHTYDAETDTVSPSVILYVCNDCGMTKVEKDYEHDYKETTIPATCTENEKIVQECVCGHRIDEVETPDSALGHDYEGGITVETKENCTDNRFERKTCQRCGYFEIYEVEDTATGHDLVSTPIYDASSNICEDGANYANYCKNEGCTYTEITNEPGKGHVVSEWDKVTDPTLKTAGMISGVCGECGKDVEIEVPALSKNSYAYDSTDFTGISCDKREGYETYTIYVNVKGELSTTATDAFAITYSLELDGTAHRLGTTIMDQEVYPEDMDGLSVLEDATCIVNGEAIFTCTECGHYVKVATTREHEWVESSLVVSSDPTCETNGIGYVTCKNCPETQVREIPATGHAYTYELVVNEDYTKFTFVGTCAKAGCEKPTTEVDVTELVTIDTANSFAATCQATGKTVYVYTNATGTYKIERELAIVAHQLNGVDMEKNGEYAYDMPGISELTEGTCAENGEGIFKCDNCQKFIPVETTREHDDQETDRVEATCETDGVIKFNCSVCGKEGLEKVIPATGHAYTYELIANDDYTVFTFVGTCDNVGCEMPVTEEEVEVTSEIKVTPNCQQKGLKVYSYVFEGTTYKVEQVLNKTAHSLNGEVMDGEEYTDREGFYYLNDEDEPTCKTKGVAIFQCDVCHGFGEVVVSEADHDYNYTVTDATCDVAGSKVGICSVCGDEVEEEIPALGHVLAYVKETLVVPTATVPGSVEVYCTRDDCEYSKTLALPVLNEETYAVVKEDEANCKKAGYVIYSYELKVVIGEVEESVVVEFKVEIPSTDHDYAEVPQEYTWIETDAEGNQYTVVGYICEDCGKMIVQSKTLIENPTTDASELGE